MYIFRGEGINLNEVSVGEIFSRETEGKHFWMKCFFMFDVSCLKAIAWKANRPTRCS